MPIKTADQYLESLRDGRVVYLNGEKVDDVTKNPILMICAKTCAMDYVLIQDPRYQSLMTTKNEEGELISRCFVPAR